MTKKKRGHPDLDEVLQRPWCYYCERDFDDLKILINHQKAKHYKCERCGRRLNTAGGLAVHMSQVHKETLSAVDNALPNRAGLDLEVFGMEGIPEDIAQQHNQRVIAQYHQGLADKQSGGGVQGGASAPGGGPGQAKKPKFESPSELKKRLAEHKARLAEQQAGGSSGAGTPLGAGQAPSPSSFHSASQYNQVPSYASNSTPPGYTAAQSPFNGPPGSQQFPGQPTPFLSQPPPQAGFPQNGHHPQTAFSPTPVPYPGQTQNAQPFPPGQFPLQPNPGGHVPFPPGLPAAPPRAYGVQSPPLQFQPNQQFQRLHTPPQNGALPARPGSLPTAPGLPQRPAVETPHFNAFQMQQMHQGQLPGPQNPVMPQRYTDNEPSSLDELISGASRQADEASNAQTAAQPGVLPTAQAQTIADPSSKDVSTANTEALPPSKSTTEEQGEEKASKKDKEKAKASRLVYADNDTSPEEKMATLARFAFRPQMVGA